jgi:hypothetical protein
MGKVKPIEGVPEVLHMFRIDRVYPLPKATSIRLDSWCVFFKVDDKLTYWLMDNIGERRVMDELGVWRKFIHEWVSPEYQSYKYKVVMGRNMEDAKSKLDTLLQRKG